MKKTMIRVLTLILVGCLLLSGGHALASDISASLYYAIITIGNSSGTNATNVGTTANVTTPDLIDGGFSNATATNMVMRNSTGADVLFMPGYATNPWVMWVESLPAHSYTNYSLYTAESTGGTTRYFPGDGGMTTDDNDVSLELGDDFEISMAGHVDTSAGADKNLVLKDNAFKVYISAEGSITVAIYEATGPADLTVYSTASDGFTQEAGVEDETWDSVHDAAGEYKNSGNALHARSRTFGVNTFDVWRSFLYFDTSELGASAIISAAELSLYGAAVPTETDAAHPDVGIVEGIQADPLVMTAYGQHLSKTTLGHDAYYDVSVAWNGQYNAITLNATGRGWINKTSTTKFCWRSKGDITDVQPTGDNWVEAKDSEDGVGLAPKLVVTYTTSAWADKATVAGISSGYHTVKVKADGVNLTIVVDEGEAGEVSDTVAVESVPPNDEDWTSLQNNSMSYMDFYKVYVGGVLKQHIGGWEYDDEFTDLSGNNNPATPTFRTTSSNEDVTATVTSFQPISEAKAPSFSLGDSPPWITEEPAISGNFTTAIEPTFPGAGVVKAVAEASATPAQLPLTIITGFIILAISLAVSSFIKRAGSSSLLLKSALIGGLMGIAIATLLFDFWMLLFFGIIAAAIAMGSQQKGWT